MCTLSWRCGDASGVVDVWFNRDELHTRAPELPPQITETETGTKHLAPRDGERGGTWLLVNDRGAVLCVLNDYDCAWRPPADDPRESRGGVPLACAAAAGPEDVAAALAMFPLARTPPFQLVAIFPHAGAHRWHWRGDELAHTDGRTAELAPPLSSSSFAPREVIAARIAYFRRHSGGVYPDRGEDFAACHRQHDPARGAYSILMRRPDAMTRSITHVRVERDRARCTYSTVRWPDATHGGLPEFDSTEYELPLRGNFSRPQEITAAP